MPLPPPTAPRQRRHCRSIQLHGYKREDGLWDLEAWMTDTKDHDYPLSTGLRQAGEAIHHMGLRVTVDRHFQILDAQGVTEAAPYGEHCRAIVPEYRHLVGLNLFQDFRRALRQRLGGVAGCSHLTELAMVLPTVALQTFASETQDNEDHDGRQPYQLDRCHALETSSEAVRRYYPRWYRGQEPARGDAPAFCSQLQPSKESA